MTKSKIALWLVCVASLALPLATFAQKKPTIIVVTHGTATNVFWAVAHNGVMQAGKDVDCTVDYRAPEKYDMVGMAQMIDAAIAAKPDGLVVSIPDVDALGRHIQDAVKAGIPVISMNSGADASKKLGCLMHIGQEEYVAGKGAGERMKAMGVKKVVIINHEVGNVGLDRRAKGFSDGFGGSAEVLAVKMDFLECRDQLAAYLQRQPDTDGIMALGADGAEPALQAIDKAGKTGKIKFGTFDLSPAILQALAQKRMDFAIDQQQWLQGYLPVVFLANYVRYGAIPASDSLLTGPAFVTSDNARQVIDLSKKGIR
ncbi:MAG TPA: sugar ABC transporter substrate-binding protein [Chthoniobacterales bacterium]|nr:sugar ABC transporter substrate-binding protein [Chthoniobacterales bacterium]